MICINKNADTNLHDKYVGNVHECKTDTLLTTAYLLKSFKYGGWAYYTPKLLRGLTLQAIYRTFRISTSNRLLSFRVDHLHRRRILSSRQNTIGDMWPRRSDPYSSTFQYQVWGVDSKSLFCWDKIICHIGRQECLDTYRDPFAKNPKGSWQQ